MILLIHIVIGAVIALKVKLLPLALVLAFFSHYFFDALPHWDYSIESIKKRQWQISLTDFLKVFLDIFFGGLILFLFSENLLLTSLGGFFAILPDGFSFLSIVFPKSKTFGAFFNLNRKVHFPKTKKISPFWKISIELALLILAIFLL